MEFREGMLGVVIVALALVSAIFVGYLAGIEGEDEEYTAYEWLADVSGNFTYDKSPTYIEYEPSTNYTGYYEEDYINDYGKFWPTEYVGYENNSHVNNYKISQMLDSQAEVTVDISDNEIEPYDLLIFYIYDIDEDELNWLTSNSVSGTTKAVSLKDLLTDMDLPESWSHAYITLGDGVGWDDAPSTNEYGFAELDLDTILILPYVGSMIYLVSPNEAVSDYSSLGVDIRKPYLSFIVDMDRWTVQCFSTSDYSGDPAILDANSMVVCYGDSTQQTNVEVLNLGNDMTYALVDIDSSDYLDPNYGVEMLE